MCRAVMKKLFIFAFLRPHFLILVSLSFLSIILNCDKAGSCATTSYPLKPTIFIYDLHICCGNRVCTTNLPTLILNSHVFV